MIKIITSTAWKKLTSRKPYIIEHLTQVLINHPIVAFLRDDLKEGDKKLLKSKNLGYFYLSIQQILVGFNNLTNANQFIWKYWYTAPKTWKKHFTNTTFYKIILNYLSTFSFQVSFFLVRFQTGWFHWYLLKKFIFCFGIV